MNKSLKLIPIGNSTGVILPKEILDRLQVGQGDQLSVLETDNGLELRAHDSDFEQQMDVARSVMERRRAALRELAK